MKENSAKPPGSIPIESTRWDSSWPELAEEDERDLLFSYLEERFGIPEKVFNDYLLLKGKKSWSLLTKIPDESPVPLLKMARAGLRAFQKVGPFVKPTTRMIQIFGKEAKRGIHEVDERQLSRLLAGQEVFLDLDMEKGYVILTFNANHILGMGFYSEGRLRSQIPRKELRENMVMEGCHADKKPVE